MENLQPKLRFPEFKEDWEETILSNIAKIQMGQSPDSNSYNNNNLGFGLIQGNADLIDRKIQLRQYTSNPTKLTNINDIIFTVRAPVGYVALCDDVYCIGRGVASITAKYSKGFLFQYFIKVEERWNTLAQGSTFTAINSKDLNNFKLNIPTLQEQTKIADFLGAVDKQLDILNQKKEKLTTYKKGVMQQLFSQQIRFKDDNGNDYPDWQEKRLLDFENLIHGDGDWILAKDIDSEGNINVIQLGNIGKGNFIDKDYKKITIETFNEIKGTPIKKGDLLINRMLNNYKLHSCLFPYNGDYITSVDVCWIRENNYFNNYFLKSLFSWEKSQEIFVSLSSGSGRIRISKKNLFERFVFKLPSIAEQNKIAEFLSAIDVQIEAVENQITKTETYKKGLLQQMFV